jgi:SAM-dependent methyltransferase
MKTRSTFKGISRRVLRGIRDRADNTLQMASPAWRARRKYEGELAYWRKDLGKLLRWYRGEADWCGIPPPPREQVLNVSGVPATNAIMTVNRLVPHYTEALLIDADAFAGQKVLEVGCGPLAPVMQFRNCERHGLDPLIDAYLNSGWPLYDLDVTFVSARAESMPYADAYFDAVISVNALDHVDDFALAASEIQRVLKTDGRVFFDIEYHEPRLHEPQRLDDALVRSSFSSCEMSRIRERSGEEKYRAMAERFGLRTDGTGQYTDDRLTVWHGVRKDR